MFILSSLFRQVLRHPVTSRGGARKYAVGLISSQSGYVRTVQHLPRRYRVCFINKRRIAFSFQGENHRIQHAKGAEEEAKLREDLKRTQEALSFLSAWDEERIELDAEVRPGRGQQAPRGEAVGCALA